MTQNAWHVRQARVAFLSALYEAGFRDELIAFAQRDPPPSFDLHDAVSSGEYAQALDDFTTGCDLHSPWFREYCHDLAWRAQHEDPARFPAQALPPPFGRIAAWFSFDLPEDLSQRAPPLQDENAALFARALWLEDTKSDARDWVLQAFDAFWNSRVEPKRREQAAPTRTRPLQNAERDARAFVARARVRREGYPQAAGIIPAAIERMQRLWPDEYAELDDDALRRSLTRFGELLRDDTDT